MLSSLCAAAPTTGPATQSSTDPLDQWVVELHAHGQPATLEDLLPPTVPADQNAALLYEQAVAAMEPTQSGPRSSAESFPEDLPYPPQWHKLADANVRRNAAAFDLVRQATTRPAVAWTSAPSPDLISSLLGSFSAQRNLANAVADAALHAHFGGNDRDAILLLHAQLRHADAIGQRPLLISKLVMLGIEAIAAQNAQILSTELTIADSKHPLRPGIQSPAPREAVHQVIAELLNDSRLLVPWHRCFGEERVFAISELRRYRLAAPQLAKTVRALSLLYDACIAATDKPCWEAEPLPTSDDPFCKAIVPSFTKPQQTVTQLLLLRRMAAVSLAVSLYRNDHGEYPPNLAALAPQYLPAVPVDPFSRTKQPLQYAVIDGKRPMVGSVGLDGVDASLPQLGLPSDARYSFHGVDATQPDDIWLDLAAWPGRK